MPAASQKQPPVVRDAAAVEHLVVRPAGLQPRVRARAHAGVRPEEAVRHLERGKLLAVEDLALGDDEPERRRRAGASERRERRRARARTGRGTSADPRGRRSRGCRLISRTGRSSRASAQLPSPMWLIRNASRAKSIAYISVNCVVAEQRRAPQTSARRSSRRPRRANAVALRHQARGGGERQPRRTGRPRRSRRSASSRRRSRARVRIRSSPSCMRAWSSRSSAVSRGSISKRLFSSSSSSRDRFGLDRLGGAVESARRERVDLRAERGEQRVHVDADVAHPVHRVAEDRDLERAPARRRRRPRAPTPDRVGERRRAASRRDDVERPAGADQRVRRVLRAVDALVVGEVGHVPGARSPPATGCDVRDADGQPRLGERARDVHRRAVGEHHHEQAVEVRRARSRAPRARSSSRSLTAGDDDDVATSPSARELAARTPPGAR